MATNKVYEYDRELQERVRAYTNQQTGVLSQAKLAQRLNVSSTTLSWYINSKMQSDPANLEGALREYFQQEEEKAEQAARQKDTFRLDSEYKPTTFSEDARQAIRFAQINRKLVVLHGDPGTGKTRAALKYREENPNSTVYIRILAGEESMACVAGQLCEKLGLPRTGGTAKMLAAIRSKLTNTNTVIIVDDAQLLRGAPLFRLCQITDEDPDTSAPGNGVVLIANSELYERIQSGKVLKQGRSRMSLHREYYAEKITVQDARLLFPQFNEAGREQELRLLWGICRGGDIRKAMDVLTNAAYNGDVSFSGLLTAAASTPGVNI